MTDIAAALADHGIKLRNHAPGDYKSLCPWCSHTRKNKRDLCLSVTLKEDGTGVFKCHNCGESGRLGPERDDQDRRRPATLPAPARPAPPATGLPEQIIKWFANRGISPAVLKRNGIGYGPHYVPGAGGEVPCIQFPYLRDGEVVNVKYRTLDKQFTQTKGAEKVFYGLDDISDREEIVICEGEPDKLALEEAGITNVISVPDGAPQKVKDGVIDPDDDAKFSYVWNCREELAGAKKIILATDNDAPGRALTEELARRLGRERCWRVTWPELGDAPRKDANEVLVLDGPKVLREVIENAQPYPIKSLHGLGAFESETLALYEHGPARTYSTGWPTLDPHMKIREGELSVITGIPAAGKSEFIDALIVNLATQYGWRFAICSFENPPAEHIAKLAEKHLGQPFWEGPTPRMSELDLRVAMQWLGEHFYFIRAGDEAPTIDWILETARAAVMRHGVRGLVIDPYNEVEHKRPDRMTETEYVSQVLGKVKRFAQAHGVHIWFVAHPAKMQRDPKGKIPVPNLYDISGSANWANKADFGVVIHRDWAERSTKVEIHVLKVRFKSVGREGIVTLHYDRATGRYTEPDPELPQYLQN